VLPQGWKFDKATIGKDQGNLEEAGMLHLQGFRWGGDVDAGFPETSPKLPLPVWGVTLA